MTRPVFLSEDVEPPVDQLEPGDHAQLIGAEGHHAATVRRVNHDELIDVVDGRGLRITCQVEGVSKDTVALVVVRKIAEAQSSPVLTLVQALAKGGRDEQAVETATEIGVQRFIPWQANRCIVRWSETKAQRGVRKWLDVARAASKQSRRAWIPEISTVLDTRELVAFVRRTTNEGGLCFVCHEEGTDRLTSASKSEKALNANQIVLIVGPEGGIDPVEISSLADAGALIVRLGSHVLRSSTAGPTAAVVVQTLLGLW